MKKEQVPQDGVYKGGYKAVYAVDRDGRYTTARTSGWEVEGLVTAMAAEEYRHLAEEVLLRARQGLCSPLEFHMHNVRMDLQTLSQSTGLFRWRIRRHFRPAVFNKLSPRMLALYADTLGMTVDALTSLPG